MSDEEWEWELPVPREDPEIYKAGQAHAGKDGVRLVPKDNIVEGQMDQERDGKDAPRCPFS